MSNEYLNVLLVEDEQTNIDAWRDAVETHNVDFDRTGFLIKWENATSLPDAREKIAISNFDAIVVDLRLRTAIDAASHNDDGNELVRELIASMPVGIVVYSGQQAEDYDCKQVVVIDRGEGLQPVFGWLTSNKDMFLSLRRAKKVLDTQTALIFYKSIWPRWSNWVQSPGQSEEFIPMAITRHMTSHVYATLLAEGQHGVHPEEWYFVPPLRKTLGTGDLIQFDDGTIEIVITPRCDLERDVKNETIQLAICKDMSEEWERRCKKQSDAKGALERHELPDGDKGIQKLEETLINATGSLRRFTQHSNCTTYHFIPRMKTTDGPELGPFYIQFDKIRSVIRSSPEAKDILPKKRIASLTSEFLPSLVERLGAYFSRIGTPDYSHPD